MIEGGGGGEVFAGVFVSTVTPVRLRASPLLDSDSCIFRAELNVAE